MARFLTKREQSRGMAPGSLVFIGNQKVDKIRIRVIDYDKEEISEDELNDIKAGVEYKKTKTVTWINIDGIHDLAFMKEVGGSFDLHPLLLEDIVNTGQRPKLDEYENCLFLVLKMLRYDEKAGKIIAEQLSLVLGHTFLLTFQEQPGDVFDPVRERIRKQKGRIRLSGIDYLAYTLLDTVADNYLYIVEKLGGEIEDLESSILTNPDMSVLEQINNLKQEMNFLRKSIRPVKDLIAQLLKIESGFILEMTIPFLKDLYDLIIHATEAIDTYRDMLSDHFNTYNSLVSNRMNDIMKVLTIIATIFIPITFVAGIYGMNFEFMPELKWKFAYFTVWGLILLIIFSMIYYFKRNKWF